MGIYGCSRLLIKIGNKRTGAKGLLHVDPVINPPGKMRMVRLKTRICTTENYRKGDFLAMKSITSPKASGTREICF